MLMVIGNAYMTGQTVHVNSPRRFAVPKAVDVVGELCIGDGCPPQDPPVDLSVLDRIPNTHMIRIGNCSRLQ